MCPIRVKTCGPLPAGRSREQLTVPPDPGVGEVQLQPAGCDSDTNVMSLGKGSFSVALVAVSGPPLFTVIVKLTSESADDISDEAVFVTPRSAFSGAAPTTKLSVFVVAEASLIPSPFAS